jgi:hypothetical protein
MCRKDPAERARIQRYAIRDGSNAQLSPDETPLPRFE